VRAQVEDVIEIIRPAIHNVVGRCSEASAINPVAAATNSAAVTKIPVQHGWPSQTPIATIDSPAS
jgi:hypothetical protein